MFRHVSSAARYAFIVAFHTIETLTCLREDELIDAILATSTRKTRSVVRVVASHDRLVENGKIAYFAVVAVRADRRAI